MCGVWQTTSFDPSVQLYVDVVGYYEDPLQITTSLKLSFLQISLLPLTTTSSRNKHSFIVSIQ